MDNELLLTDEKELIFNFEDKLVQVNNMLHWDDQYDDTIPCP